MNVIICGAGLVGFHIARQLASEDHDVTVVDSSEKNIRTVDVSLEVRTVTGFASYPGVLDQANAGDADMLIAVTPSDEVNMVACQVAHSLFSVPTKIARVRSRSYLQPQWSDLFRRDHMPIDVIISPELEVAKTISRDLVVPGAFDYIPMAEGRVRVVGVRCNHDCPVINTPLRQLTGVFPDLNIVVVGIIRDGKMNIPGSNDQMMAGDDVYFVADAEHVARAMTIFGHEEKLAQKLIILGGGNVGLFLAQQVKEEHPGVSTRIIESDEARANLLGRTLPRDVIVLNGNGLEPEILEEAGVHETETIVAVTNDDETNILGSLLAKRHGTQRAIALVNNTNYPPLVTTLGVDAVVTPRSITASTILRHVRHGRIRSVHSLGEQFGEVLETEVFENSLLAGTAVRDMDLPNGVLLGAIVRASKVITPRSDTVVQKEDRVILFAHRSAVRDVEKILSVPLEYF